MLKSGSSVGIAILAMMLSGPLCAQVIPEALLSFPAQTQYLEYDNLAELRALPNYSVLREKFAGKPLEDAKASMLRLGIQEDQVHEIVSGSSAKAFYGLVGGTFSGQAAAVRGRQHGMATRILTSEAFCPKDGTCVVFLENSLAAFGTLAELKEMLETRQGLITRLNSNRAIVTLLNNTDQRAPVRGLICGNELNTTLSDMLKESTGWNMDWSKISSNISALAYSVRFDSKAHVAAVLECASKTAAALLAQTLNAMASLQSVSASSGVAFQNLQVSSSGNTVDFKADTPLPAAPAKK